MLFTLLLFIAALYIGLAYYTSPFLKGASIVAIPFVKIFINRRIDKGLENPARKNERFGMPSHVRPFGKLIWVHAASVGEILSIIPFIEEFKRINKDVLVLVTTMTLTSADVLKKRLGNTVIHQLAPFDIYPWIKRFLKFWRPDTVFFVESELWPNTLYYLFENDITTYLLNARVSNKTLDRLHFVKKFFNVMPFMAFRTVFVSSQSLIPHVKELGSRDTACNPNIKIISPKLPTDKAFIDKLKPKINDRKVWMAVSTHEGEEEKIIATHKELKKQYSDLLTVIAIRHPERAGEVQKLCESMDVSSSCHTKAFDNENTLRDDIYIIDQIGCLGNFFEIIDTVLMCGSLIPGIGGHNVLEPLHFRCSVATGPYTENFDDILREIPGRYTVVHDQGELVAFIQESFAKKERPHYYAKKEVNFMDIWRNSIKRISMNISSTR
ncbi:MAG: hypothetical protein LBF65_00040 [Holosporales bacterium]|jgi:3-deoxy-D-manno-octulosonic-acid transferase|nr:hypothetical protein [Holosporales bacterium]